MLLLVLLPFVFAQVLVTALVKLRLDPGTALLVISGIILGSLVNIPVTRIVRHEDVVSHPFATFGLMHFWPQLQRVRRETVIAVNVGGSLIPANLAAYEILQLMAVSRGYIPILSMAVVVNTSICYWLAKPVSGVGIAMPAFIPQLLAALVALF